MPTSKVIIEKARERAMLAYKYRKEGMIFRKIGEQLGVSSTRAQQLFWKAERLLKAEEENK
jgi:DNA-directed RNA polymerase specialized sigma subunit